MDEATNTQIEDQKMDATLNCTEHRIIIAQHGKELEEVKAKVEELTKWLRGNNGNPGLIADVRENTEFRKEFQGTLRKVLYALVLSIVTALGSGIITLLK